jgi:hypothetical protein
VVEKESLRGPLQLLRAAAFISTFDRLTIAAALGVSLEQAAAAAVSFGPLFALAALSAIPLGLVGSAAHLSYDRAS